VAHARGARIGAHPSREGVMKTAALLGAAAPRYVVVAQALMRDIERGTFKVGDMLPTELDICGKFGVSRYTAREAIRRLTEAGLVTRRAGVGTTVMARTVSARYTASVSDLTELFVYNSEARLTVLAEDWVAVRGELATILPGAEGQRWVRFTAQRHVAGAADPIVYTEILVHPAYEGIRERIREPGAMVYRLIEEMYREQVVELRQEIGCIAMPRKIANVLGARAGAPALRVLRYYVGQREALMSVSINTYPHERFKLSTRWRLDWDKKSS
jgi:DNA-binding GntR family transcriptional regulator